MKNSIIKAVALLLCTGIVLSLCACKTENQPIKLLALKGPTGMGMAYIAENMSDKYETTFTAAPDSVVSAFSSGEAQIAAVPINLASTLYNKLNGDCIMLAINTLGVLYIMENGNSIKSISDLQGKTIVASGKGSTPEYILQYLLDKNNIQANIEFKSEHSEVAALIASGSESIVMLPEPNVTATTLKSDKARIALNLTEEWNKISDTKLAQGCLIAKKSFVDANSEKVEQFISDYRNSTLFVNDSPTQAAQLIAKYEIMASAAAAEKAIPNCNIVIICANEMKATAEGMFNVLFEQNPKSIGGALPKANFYYMADASNTAAATATPEIITTAPVAPDTTEPDITLWPTITVPVTAG